MRLPRPVFTAALAARQLPSLLPSDFCNPICPSCRTDVALFDKNISCAINSSFLNDCSACQQCIISYQNEQGPKFQGEIFQVVLVNVLNLCSNSTVAAQVAVLQSQASKLSSVLAKSRTSSAISSATSTSTPAIATSSIKPAPVTSSVPTQNSDQGTSNISLIVGPSVGVVLGLAAILIVIFLIRRQQKQQPTNFPVETKEVDDDSEPGDSTRATPQPLPEIVEPKELEAVEVYELPAAEPVGIELHTPRDGKMDEEDWPLPMGPLRAMFVEAEMRDERMGDESPNHQTFYNP